MEQNLTPDHLIQYLYKETSVTETLAIQEALMKNIVLREEYEELFSAYRELPKVTFRPSPAALRNILRYSERAALENHV